MSEPVSLTFSLKYLTNFCKASGLSHSVKLCLSSEVPLLVEYNLGVNNSYLRFYLAPKVRNLAPLHQSISNQSRLATRNKRIMSLLAHKRHTFRIDVVDLLRNCSNMHGAPVGSLVSVMLYCRERARACGVRRPRHKRRVTPHQNHLTSYRGTSDKEINSTSTPSPACACAFPVFS